MDYEKLKKEAINRQRRIIFDNDGCDVLYECKEATADELLKQRMYQIINTQVDSVFCATMSSGFGQFTHRTKIGSIFTSKEDKYCNNVTKEFIEQGTDHFKIMVDFCRKNNIEIFWQMRMNDTHDGSNGTWYGPILFNNNNIKKQHPEYLIGSINNKPKYGAWSAVNYSIPEVRVLALEFIEEVCDNYDIDGINLDFFRHPVFFKSTSNGELADESEISVMTDLIKHIAYMLEQKGRERRKPLLLAVRVPDSVEYCRAIGLDIEKWLSQGYVDLLLTSSYIQLNNWEYSAKLAHKYNVKFYPSLDECRIKDQKARALRDSPECYRARAMNAWNEGADGIYLFNYKAMDLSNYSNDNSTIFNEIGDKDALQKLNKKYVVSPRGLGAIAGGGLPHREYTNISVLNPDNPERIEYGKTCLIKFPIGDNVKWGEKEGIYPIINLSLRIDGISDASVFNVFLNGSRIFYKGREDIWFQYNVNDIITGYNTLTIEQNKELPTQVFLLDVMVSIKYTDRGH